MMQEPGPNQRRIQVGKDEIWAPKDGVEVSKEPITVEGGGGIRMEMPATTFTWTLDFKSDLIKALRQHIHRQLSHVPSQHFVTVEPAFNSAGAVSGVKVSVVVPENQ